MVPPVPPLVFDTDFDARTGRPVQLAPAIVRVTAPNSGPYTFTGTNSYVIGDGPVFLVDPGPDDSSHLIALRKAIAGRKLEAIILTHTHRDHTGLIERLRREVDAPVWFGGKHRLSRPSRLFEVNPVAFESDWKLVPDRVLTDGESIEIAGIRLEAVATPGHCANHLAFGVVGTPWLLTGDHIMGWNSTLVPVPDGSMSDYLRSLHKVIGLSYQHYLPGHGGEIADGPTYSRALLAHREQRNDQIVAAVTAGATTLHALRRRIYPTLALPLHRAALMTLKAHVEYLADQRRIGLRHGLFGPVLFPARD
jgi:glyoxylase-like metal-dependent hydrolase (beta-lactamase superfamily II)